MHRHHLVICLITTFIEVLNCDLELNHSNKKYVKAFSVANCKGLDREKKEKKPESFDFEVIGN